MSQATIGNGVVKMSDLLVQWGVNKKADDSESGGPSSTHPTATADDHTVPGAEKAPGAENSAILKEDNPQGPNEKVSAAKKAALDATRRLANLPPLQAGKKADEPLTNVGASETGSKPEAETASAAGVGNDTGTTHPAHIDNPELGGKYSSFNELRQMCKDLDSLGEKIAHAIISTAGSPTVVPGTPSASAAFQQGKHAASEILDDPVAQKLAALMEEPAMLAHEVADYLDVIRKQASQGKRADGMPMDPAMLAGAGGGAPPGGGMPMDPAAAGGGAPPGGGMPMDPAAMAGGAPPGAGGGQEEQLMQLEQLLQELNLTPEQLTAILTGSGEGDAGGGGAPPGAPPPEVAAPASEPPAGGEKSEEKSEPKPEEGESGKEAAAVQPKGDEVMRKAAVALRERLAKPAASAK